MQELGFKNSGMALPIPRLRMPGLKRISGGFDEAPIWRECGKESSFAPVTKVAVINIHIL